MKLKICTILIVFVFALSDSMLSQEIIYSNDKQEITSDIQEIAPLNETNSESIKDKSKISYQVEIGSSFSTGSLNGNALSFYTAPKLRYKLAPKLNISAGFILINTSISDYYSAQNQQKRNINQSYLFTGFDYQASEKLRISGEVLYGMNKSPVTVSKTGISQDYSVRFSAEYKINENFSIGLQVINQNMGNNSFGHDPFGNYPSITNPFAKY